MKKPDPASLAALLPAADAVLDQLPSAVRVYCVGGAVRDHLLGLPKADRDFVVVGATIEAMIRAGFTPVGKDFPVFLHPISHDEYALARTERKSGKGYKGFTFNADPAVTLEEDLSRRDLTVNAMAVDASGQLIDPFGGWNDLQNHCFRHVGPAFLEDPVRLLRLSRFAAKWPEFTIAQETQALCQEMVAAGEANALIAERVWQEISKGLMERQPSRMLAVLSLSGAWAAITQSPDIRPATQEALDNSAAQAAAIEVRFALLTNDHPPVLLECFKAPRQLTEIAGLLAASLQQLPALTPCLAALSAATKNDSASLNTLLEWFERADLWRRPERLELLLSAHYFRQDLTPAVLETLAALAAHLNSADSHQRIAARVQAAQTAGSVISDGVREEKRLLIHGFFASPT